MPVPTARSRVVDAYTFDSGSLWKKYGGTTLRSRKVGSWHLCEDTVGNYPLANGLDILHERHSEYTLNGKFYSGSTLLAEMQDLPAYGGFISPPEPWIAFPKPSWLELSNYAWQILSKTNPNVEDISVPTFIGELRDFPRLFQVRGRNVLQRVSGGYVNYQFGWKPMLSDIRRMLQFQRSVEERLRMLRNLRDGKWISRRCFLESDKSETDPSAEFIINSDQGLVKARHTTTYQMKVWGSCQFSLAPGTELPPPGSDSEWLLAWRLTTGVTGWGGVKTLWNLLPWSWFVDWFAGIGDLIDATNNTIPMIHRNLCVMRTISAKKSYSITSKPSWMSVSGQRSEERERKERILAAPLVPFIVEIPAITATQWSILGAIGLSRYA